MRLFRLLPLMLFLLLCGCQGGDSAAGSLPDLDKAQEVRVIPAGETAPTQVLTEKSQIEALILAMDLDHWSTADLPQGLSLDVAISEQAAQELTHNLFP